MATTPISNPPPTWKVPFKLVPKPVMEPPKQFKSLSKDDVLSIVTRHLRSGVVLKSVIASGGACTIEVQVSNKSDISILLNSLSTEKKLSQPELLEIVKKQNKWNGKIYLKAYQM